MIYVIKKGFSNVELDDAALATLMGMGGEQQARGGDRPLLI